jgi:hypothetical protein
MAIGNLVQKIAIGDDRIVRLAAQDIDRAACGLYFAGEKDDADCYPPSHGVGLRPCLRPEEGSRDETCWWWRF